MGRHLALQAVHGGGGGRGGFTMWVGGCASSALHVVIAIERFYATRPDNLVRNKIRRTKLKLEVPPFCVMVYDRSCKACKENWPKLIHAKVYAVFTFLVDFAIPLILMAVLYTKTVTVLWGRSVNLATAQAVIKTRKRVTKIAITVTVLHALCWLPDVTSYLLAYHAPA